MEHWTQTIAAQWPLVIGVWLGANVLFVLGLMAFGRPER